MFLFVCLRVSIVPFYSEIYDLQQLFICQFPLRQAKSRRRHQIAELVTGRFLLAFYLRKRTLRENAFLILLRQLLISGLFLFRVGSGKSVCRHRRLFYRLHIGALFLLRHLLHPFPHQRIDKSTHRNRRCTNHQKQDRRRCQIFPSAPGLFPSAGLFLRRSHSLPILVLLYLLYFLFLLYSSGRFCPFPDIVDHCLFHLFRHTNTSDCIS